MDFIECEVCAAKPGSPTLCVPCLKNRDTIGFLKSKIERDENFFDLMRSTLKLEEKTEYGH